MKKSVIVSSTQSMQPQLMAAVPDIFDDQQRIIEEDLLRFALANVVLIGSLAAIALIPIETFDLREINHLCILP